MNIFKIGDEVRCIDAKETNLTHGDVYNVITAPISLDIISIQVKTPAEQYGPYHTDRFELVSRDGVLADEEILRLIDYHRNLLDYDTASSWKERNHQLSKLEMEASRRGILKD